MALDKDTLEADLVTMMNNAKSQSWTADQVAQAMSEAIDRYVRGADVTGVKIAVQAAEYGQSGKGKLQ